MSILGSVWLWGNGGTLRDSVCHVENGYNCFLLPRSWSYFPCTLDEELNFDAKFIKLSSGLLCGNKQVVEINVSFLDGFLSL